MSDKSSRPNEQERTAQSAVNASSSPIPNPYTNPTSLLRAYPFAQYTPTGRTAGHIATHTVTYPPPGSSNDFYPQYANLFTQIDNPRHAADWQVRHQAEAQMQQLFSKAGPSYATSYAQPSSSGHTYPSPVDHAFPSSVTGQPAPLPYSFLNPYMADTTSFRDPPTPTSMVDVPPSPTLSTSASEYFESYVDQTIRRSDRHRSNTPNDAQTQSSSVTSTPTIARQLSRTALTPAQSPDPLSLPGPSPSKRRKPTDAIRVEDIPLAASSQSKAMTTATQSSLPANGFSKGKQRLESVEIPIRRKLSADVFGSSSLTDMSKGDESEEDDLEWGEDEAVDDDGDWTMGKSTRNVSPDGSRPIPPGSGRTGDRDMRTHFQRFLSLLEDIFEESDSFSANPLPEDIAGSRYFGRLNKDGTQPLLSNATIEQITRYVIRVHKSKRRQVPTAGNGESLDWDAEAVARALRFLERSMRDGDGLIVFKTDKQSATSAGKSGKKVAKGKQTGKKASKSPEIDPSQGTSVQSDPEDGPIRESAFIDYEEQMSLLASTGLAAQACLVLLDIEDLPRQLLSEDLLSCAISLVKDQVSKAIIPVMEGLAGSKINSKYLAHIVASESGSTKGKGKALSPFFRHTSLSTIAQSCCSSIPHITSLITRPDMSLSDSLVIQTVYLAIEPLFIADAGSKKGRGRSGAEAANKTGSSAMGSLRIEALGCLRGVFSRYDKQRQWIIEEILSSMVRVSDKNNAQSHVQLAQGPSIHTITVVLLQLVQASSFGVSASIRQLQAKALEAAPLPDDPDQLSQSDQEVNIYADSTEAALLSARVIAGYLIQKSSSTRSTKSSHDTDYKAILELFLSDLLAILYRPEWPAAAMFLNVLSRLLMSSLEDVKGDSGPKGLAIDHLGDIASKLRAVHSDISPVGLIPSIDEIISNADLEGMRNLLRAHSSVRTYLSSVARDDAMFESSRDMSNLTWAQELQSANKRASSVVEKLANEKDEEAQETRHRLQNISQSLRSTLMSVWTEDGGLFEVTNHTQAATAATASVAIARGRSLQSAFEPILHALVSAMDTTQVTVRSKALRALSGIVTVDPDILSSLPVRLAIEGRLSDSSPQVRDAAIELIGKYVVQKPSLAVDYYPFIAPRVADAGLGVRKRVIKLLKGIFSTTNIDDIRVDICCKLLSLVNDHDDTVKDLAMKTLTDILYPSESSAKAFPAAQLLVDIIGVYEGDLLSMENALQEVEKENGKLGHPNRTAVTVEALIGRLVDATEQSDFDAVGHIRAINLLSTGHPLLIDTNRAAVLLTYLRHPPSNTDEQIVNDLLLRIFRRCIPHMPRTASTFASDLTKVLMPMINKPTGGLQGLKEIIGCFCTVTNHLTREYTGLLRILRACEVQIRGMRNEWLSKQSVTLAQAPTTPMMLYITALVAEHCDLDSVAVGDQAVKREVEKIAGDRPPFEHLYDTFMDFAEMPIQQTAPTACLGSLFRAYPSLILRDQTTQWIENVFSSTDEDNQARLLGVIQEFLVAEVEKKASKAVSNRHMEALVGNANDLSDSGVSTAVAQRNLSHILTGAKSQHSATRDAALDILSFTVSQGLNHPLQCLPILIALETSDNSYIADRAMALHSTLHAKHATLVNVRFLDYAKASYQYQRELSAEVSGSRDGMALLAGWYSLVGEKKQWRNDFLKAMGRAFDYDLARSNVPDVGLVLYIAENLATLDYKLQEEVMAVIQQLASVVSASHHLSSTLDTAALVGDPLDPLTGKTIFTGQSGENLSAELLINCSIVVSLAILLKNTLLDQYNLSEDKCLKHVTGKKSAVGDKPAIRKSQAGLDLGRLPFARGVITVQEFASQSATFLQLLHEDGSLGDDNA